MGAEDVVVMEARLVHSASDDRGVDGCGTATTRALQLEGRILEASEQYTDLV